MSTELVHVFRYKYVRLQVGLEHYSVEFNFELNKTFKYGTYAYARGQWFYCSTRRPNGSIEDLVTTKINTAQVPREIKTICLLLT